MLFQQFLYSFLLIIIQSSKSYHIIKQDKLNIFDKINLRFTIFYHYQSKIFARCFINIIEMNANVVQEELTKNFIREGLIFKRSKFLKEWDEHWLVLTMNFIFIFHDKSKKMMNAFIDLRDVQGYKSYVRKDDEMIPAGFKITTQDQMHYLCTKSLPQKWSWLVSLERVMDYKNVGKTLYNSMEEIKTKGFLAQEQFENGNYESPLQTKQKSPNQQTISSQIEKKGIQTVKSVTQAQNLSAEERKAIQDNYKLEIANLQGELSRLHKLLLTNEDASKLRQIQLNKTIRKLELDLKIWIQDIKKHEEKEKILNNKICQLELNSKQAQILRKNHEQLQGLSAKKPIQQVVQETQTIIDRIELSQITEAKSGPIKEQFKELTVNTLKKQQQVRNVELKTEPLTRIVQTHTQHKPVIPTSQKRTAEPTNNPIKPQSNEIPRQRKSNFKSLYEMALEKKNIKKQPSPVKLDKKDSASRVADMKKKFQNTAQVNTYSAIKSPQKATIPDKKKEKIIVKPLIKHVIMSSFQYELAQTMIGFSLSHQQRQLFHVNSEVINDSPMTSVKELISKIEQVKESTIQIEPKSQPALQANRVAQIKKIFQSKLGQAKQDRGKRKVQSIIKQSKVAPSLKRQQNFTKPLINHTIMDSFKYELAETMIGFSLSPAQQQTFYVKTNIRSDQPYDIKDIISQYQISKEPLIQSKSKEVLESSDNKTNRVAEIKKMLEDKASQQKTTHRSSINWDQIKPSIKTEQKRSIQQELHLFRSKTVINLFEQFHSKSFDNGGLRFIIEFIIKIGSERNYGYQSFVISQAKTHNNRYTFAEVLVSLIKDYNDYSTGDKLAKFIEAVIFEAPGIFKNHHFNQIKSKLYDIFLQPANQINRGSIVKTMFILHKLKNYEKDQTLRAALQSFISNSESNEENIIWARKLFEDV